MSKKASYSTKINPKTGLPLLDEESKLSFQPKHGLIYWLIGKPVFLLSRLVFPSKVNGQNNIPQKSGVVIASNHSASFNMLTISTSARRKLFFLGKIELTRGWKGFFVNSVGTIPVDRARRNSESLDVAVQILKQGGAIVIFPEGKTNYSETLAPFKFGAVAMAGRAGVPIIPTVIVGKYTPFRRKISITYGEPLRVDVNHLEEANEKLWYTINSMREKVREEK